MKIALLSFLLFILVVLGALPSLVSTSKGQEIALKWINSSIPGHLAVRKVKLGWVTGQKIEGLSLADAEGKIIFCFEHFSTQATLANLLIGRLHLGKTTLMAPYLYLSEDKEERLNIDEALGRKKSSRPERERKREFSGDLQVTKGEVVVTSSRITPITLSNLTIDIQKNGAETFHIAADTKQGLNTGSLLLTGHLDDQLHVSGSIRNFPLALIDQLQESGIYEIALGSTLNAEFDIVRKQKYLKVTGNIESPNLKGVVEGYTEEKKFQIEKGDITFTVTPAFFNALFPTKEWSLANRPLLTLHIEQFILPLNKRKLELNQIPFMGKLELERAEVHHKELGALSFNNFAAKLSSADHVDLEYVGNIQGRGEPTKVEGKVIMAKGPRYEFSGNFKGVPVDLVELLSATNLPLVKQLLGEQFSLVFEGKYDKEINTIFGIESPTCKIEGVLEGESLQDLFTSLNGELKIPKRYSMFTGPNPKIALEADLYYKKGNFAVPRLLASVKSPYLEGSIKGQLGEKGKPFEYKDAHLVATGTFFRFPIPNYILDYEGTFFLNFDGAKNQALGSINLQSIPEGEESVHINVHATRFISDNTINLSQMELDAVGKVHNFPVQFFDTFFDADANFTYLFGPKADIDGTLIFAPSKEQHAALNLEARASGFLLDISFYLDENARLTQSKPALLQWQLTPERYHHLMELALASKDLTTEYYLAETAVLNITLDKFNCQELPPPSLKSFLCHGGFEGKIEATPLIFHHATKPEVVAFEKIEGVISAQNFSKALTVVLSTPLSAPTIPAGQKSAFSGKLELLNFLTSDGKINKEGFTVKADLVGDLLPVRALTGILPATEIVREGTRAFLGDLLNAHIYGELARLSGPVTIDIKASNFKGIFPLQFSNGALTLRNPVETELTLTEEVNRVVLKEVNPILISGAWSDHPIKLYIDSEGFYLPLRDYSFRAVHIEKAIIDLGKLRVRNGGEIMALMKFLKAKDISPEGVMEAWFTPIFISLIDGVSSYKRFDALLAGTVHIAMWGKIDLNKDKVRMTLGISPNTLQQRYNVMGLSKKEMFQVKMRGSTTELELDWSSAYTRIGILLTRTAGGHLGYLLGGILEQIVGLFGEETTPPPTTHPFPWDESNPLPSPTMPQETAYTESTVKRGLKKALEFLIP